MEIADPLPELGEMIPKVGGTMIEWNGKLWLQMKLSDIPAHEVVRYGFRLFTVHEWDPEMEAWEVQPLTATVSMEDMKWLERF